MCIQATTLHRFHGLKDTSWILPGRIHLNQLFKVYELRLCHLGRFSQTCTLSSTGDGLLFLHVRQEHWSEISSAHNGTGLCRKVSPTMEFLLQRDSYSYDYTHTNAIYMGDIGSTRSLNLCPVKLSRLRQRISQLSLVFHPLYSVRSSIVLFNEPVFLRIICRHCSLTLITHLRNAAEFIIPRQDY